MAAARPSGSVLADRLGQLCPRPREAAEAAEAAVPARPAGGGSAGSTENSGQTTSGAITETVNGTVTGVDETHRRRARQKPASPKPPKKSSTASPAPNRWSAKPSTESAKRSAACSAATTSRPLQPPLPGQPSQCPPMAEQVQAGAVARDPIAGFAGLPGRQPRQRARPPRGRRLRRRRAGRRARHPRLHLRRGRPARPRPRLPRGLRAPRRRRRGPLRQQGLPCTAAYRLFAEEGLSVDVASGGELHMALARRLRPRPHPHARQQQDRRGDPDGRPLRHRPPDPRLLRRDRALRAAARRSRSEVLIRVTPGIKPSTHDYITTGQLDSKFGFGLGDGLRGAGDRAGARLRHARPGRACTPTSARRSSSSSPTAGDRRARRAGRRLVQGRQRRRRPRRRLHRRGRAALDRRLRRRQGARRRARSSATGVRILIEPGRSLVANAGVTAYRVGTVKEIPGDPHLRRRRRRHVRQPAADALRLPLRGADRRSRRGRARHPGDRRRHALRVRRHPRPRRDAGLAGGRRRPRHPGDRRLRLRDGRATTTACPGRRWSSAATARPASSSAARPTTTSPPAMSERAQVARNRFASACSAAAPSAPPSPSCSPSAPRRSRRRPAAGRRSPGC